jgi:hypothetical protein
MSIYKDELLAAERQGSKAHDAMEAWVSRPPDAPDDIPGAVLEGYARDLRQSRERLLKLLSEHGNRDDIVESLARNEAFHRGLGLSMKDKPSESADE